MVLMQLLAWPWALLLQTMAVGSHHCHILSLLPNPSSSKGRDGCSSVHTKPLLPPSERRLLSCRDRSPLPSPSFCCCLQRNNTNWPTHPATQPAASSQQGAAPSCSSKPLMQQLAATAPAAPASTLALSHAGHAAEAAHPVVPPSCDHHLAPEGCCTQHGCRQVNHPAAQPCSCSISRALAAMC